MPVCTVWQPAIISMLLSDLLETQLPAVFDVCSHACVLLWCTLELKYELSSSVSRSCCSHLYLKWTLHIVIICNTCFLNKNAYENVLISGEGCENSTNREGHSAYSTAPAITSSWSRG